MTNEELVLLEKVAGSAQAEALRGLLEAQGVEVILSQESAGQSTFPVTYGLLGTVQILVRRKDEQQAREILEEYYAGKFEEQESTKEKDEDNQSND